MTVENISIWELADHSTLRLLLNVPLEIFLLRLHNNLGYKVPYAYTMYTTLCLKKNKPLD